MYSSRTPAAPQLVQATRLAVQGLKCGVSVCRQCLSAIVDRSSVSGPVRLYQLACYI